MNKNSDQLNKPIRRQGGLHKKDEEMFGDKYFGLLKFENEESYRYTKEGKYYRYEEYDKTWCSLIMVILKAFLEANLYSPLCDCVLFQVYYSD